MKSKILKTIKTSFQITLTQTATLLSIFSKESQRNAFFVGSSGYRPLPDESNPYLQIQCNAFLMTNNVFRPSKLIQIYLLECVGIQ